MQQLGTESTNVYWENISQMSCKHTTQMNCTVKLTKIILGHHLNRKMCKI